VKPLSRTIVASLFRGGDCLGGTTHVTEVIPAGYSGCMGSEFNNSFSKVIDPQFQSSQAER
jgi:hypothetical protein